MSVVVAAQVWGASPKRVSHEHVSNARRPELFIERLTRKLRFEARGRIRSDVNQETDALASK
jgi:hypothetical protein